MRILKGLTLVAILLTAPAAVYAQGAITGVVRDTSGAVLPGVTVEAASDALIEKVRTAVTDGTGQYRIVDLRTGTYTVSFTLPGFTTVIREGIELAGTFTATVNAELRVGTVEESITITGQTPIVDIQSATRQDVLNSEILTSIPVARDLASVAVLIPGMNASGGTDVGGLRDGATVTNFSAHGGRADDGHVKVDGMGVGGPTGGAGVNQGGGGVSYFQPNVSNLQEVVITTSGGLGESETGGPQINLVPREGGNQLSGSFFGSFANSAMQSSHAVGAASDDLKKTYDVSGAFGGPIVRDRLWFFWSGRTQLTEKKVPLMFYNLNAGTDSWFYEPDFSRPAATDSRLKGTNLRLTGQLTARNKLSLYLDGQWLRDYHKSGGSPTVSPEAAPTADAYPQRRIQVSWQAPMTNRLLLEASFVTHDYDYGGREREGNNTRDLIRVNDTGIQAGLQSVTYRSMNWNENHASIPRWRASAAYVIGAHSMKVGMDGRRQSVDVRNFTNNHAIAYTFRNGIPQSLTMQGSNPFHSRQVSLAQAIYAQEQWTLKRLTLQTGLRYDYASSYYPEQTFGGTPFHPDVFVFPEDREGGITGFHDLNTRVNVVYDLTGDGKTAVKFNAGRYLDAAAGDGRWQLGNPLSRIQTTVGRSWNDANGNFIPDCDLLNPAAQNTIAEGGDSCGAWNNTTFGQQVFTTTYDPLMFRGWHTRPMEWAMGASVQREITSGMSVEVGWHRRWVDKWTLIENRANTHDDFDPYFVMAPVDPRLGPASGRVIDDLWDIRPEKFGLFDRHTILEDTLHSQGINRTSWWHGVDVNVVARFANGLTIRGGGVFSSSGTDWCSYIEHGYYGTGIPEGPSRRNCYNATPVQTEVSGLATYTIPLIEVQVAGTFRSNIGPAKQANVQFPSSVIAQSLGRNPAGNPATVTVPLFDTNEAFYPQINVLDLRVGKLFRIGGRRANLTLDIFNALNSSTGVTYNNTYSLNNPSLWGTPTRVLAARFAKVGLQFDF